LVRALGLGIPAGELAWHRARGPGAGVLRPGVPGRGPALALGERYAVRRVPVRRALLDAAELDRFENQLGVATMSAMSERTRLGLDILGAATLAGVLGDALLRAAPWGLNAFLCIVVLIAAAWWLVRRHHVAVTRDALWLAGAALLIASNFLARDATILHLFDAVGLVILLAVASLSLKGVALRGRQAWHYVHAGIAGATLVLAAGGLTYAEYARRGFFELVTASALVLHLLTGADWLLRHEPAEHQRTFRQLATVLLLLLAVVMASALERMRLYVSA